MTVTAQNQSITNTTIPEVLEAGIPAVIQNIRAAQRRVSCDDLTSRFFDNAVQSAEMLLAQAIDVHNGEVDNYNTLLDLYENTQLKLGLKDKELEDLQLRMEQCERQKQDEIDEATHEANQRADKAEQLCLEMENKLNEHSALLEVRNRQVNTLNKSYKEVMRLDPFNLEKRYAKAKRERQELRKQVADLNQQIKKHTKDLSEARVAYAKQKAETVRLAEETTKYRNLQKEMYGITLKRFKSNKKHPTLGSVTFYPRLLAYGISAPKQFNTERPYIVSKLDFAYQFCCDMGYSLDIRINEWLMPNFHPIPTFEEYQPEGWIEFFHELICEEMEARRPELVRRVEWAQELMLVDADLPLDAQLIEELADKGLHTLFDVVTRRHAQLVANYDLTPETAKTLLDVCYSRSDAWEKENGGAIYVR
ncbi:hypothetical protein ICL29_004058 [Salmonella enterica]|nr:hypothetical protein [Salmonella enterica]EHK5999335.1 hypothetical protein [Salmonella enterica]EIF5124554.1 hypothetical protein [Salmonella enterica]EIF5348730.1 hypothetical protein [Salmonella enterica]EIF5657327.1 hypothetical protein [Salmonella enterica]